jgi:hypothetical protein
VTAPESIEVGQVWQDWDVRLRPGGGRKLRVVEVTETHAILETIGGQHWSHGKAVEVGKRTKVKTARLRPTSTGYRRLS